jgi:multimeric flavodoxin WrbA
MPRILAINGSYRPGGAMDQAVAIAAEAARHAGAEVEVIHLRATPIEFCQNCRACTQEAGPDPGACVQHDGMATLVGKIEAADAFILASPTNFYAATAVFKRFMERLVV